MKYCKNCITPSSRPRLTFSDDGFCNACLWHEKKQTVIDWDKRWKRLEALCDRFRGSSEYDVIVPCSGGKDGSTVAWTLREKLNMNPLCVTFAPQIQTHLGRQNLDHFRHRFSHILITPDTEIYKKFAKSTFIENGMPKQPFVAGISTSVLRTAIEKKIQFIMWGEQGEQEYGGAQVEVQTFNRKFLLEIYYEGQDPSKYGYWWQVPSQNDLDRLYSTWYSLYADWDPDEHARLAQQKCGLEMMVGGSVGTFTNASQLDDVLQDLHTYLQFVKFGFGRCTSDASIEIRRGRMTREQGVKVVNELDGQFPVEYIPAYLDYFEMTEPEFWSVIDRHANKDLLVKTGNTERPYILKEPIR